MVTLMVWFDTPIDPQYVPAIGWQALITRSLVYGVIGYRADQNRQGCLDAILFAGSTSDLSARRPGFQISRRWFHSWVGWP